MTRKSLPLKPIGARLRLALRARDITQSRVATDFGQPSSYVSDVIRGRRHLREDFAAFLCKNRKINLSWLYVGEGPMLNVPEAAPETLVEASLRALADDVRDATARANTPPPQISIYSGDADLNAAEGEDQYVAIPFMADMAAAGAGRAMEDEVEGYVVIHRAAAPKPENLQVRPDW